MRCFECGHTNVPGSLFCERCGADLSLESAPPDSSAAEPEAREPCPGCGHPNPAEHRVCEACGAVLRPEPVVVPAEEAPARRLETGDRPEPLPAPEPEEAVGQLVTGPRKGKVKLVVEQGMVVGKQFLLTTEQMLVGREDPAESIFPDVDLTGLDEGYVHRRHAVLTFEGSFLFVTHLGGRNRTYVNNRPIADKLAHPLNIGDTVRFGKVLLRVTEA